MAKRKKLTIAGEIEKAAVTMQKLVRMKAADDNGYVSCITCPKGVPDIQKIIVRF